MDVPSESRLNEAILDLTTTRRARNVARNLPLHRLLALQERAIGMISVDTGPAHSAGALGCPLVVLFGTADPDHYAPRSPSDAVVARTRSSRSVNARHLRGSGRRRVEHAAKRSA